MFLRSLCRFLLVFFSLHVDGWLSGGSRVRRPGSKDPHRRERKYLQNYKITFAWNIIYRITTDTIAEKVTYRISNLHLPKILVCFSLN